MPQYKVIAPGFHKGQLYKPNSKRDVLRRDKPYTKKDPMPSWLAEMPQETEAARKKREKKEKAAEKKAAAKKKQDEKEIAAAASLGSGKGDEKEPAAKNSKVTTL